MRALSAALLAATVALSGCQVLKPAADVASAAVELPVCRVQLVQYLGPDVERIAPELGRLDAAFERVLGAIDERPDVSLTDALSYGTGLTVRADSLEGDWQAVRAGVADIVSERGEAVPANLAGCADRVESGWSALRDNDGVTAARDWIAVYGPLARAGLLLLL